MSEKKWKTTQIYQALIQRSGQYRNSINNLCENPGVLDKIETILKVGETTPKDFTLHDEEHSFRVAEKMWELIPEVTKAALTEYELGFLLLSAYLHDIGMSPSYDTVKNHREYLTTTKKDSLTESEIESFQKWIDDDDKAKNINIRKECLTDEKEIHYILAYYVRHKHNEWSGDWIRQNLASHSLLYYPQWYDDLILLCQSHHYGLEVLEQEKFDPKPIGNTHVHLRYLAMCLRVADVMENDPERTPAVIIKHRSIDPDSLKYWVKDKFFTLRRDGNTFHLFSEPPRAYIHKAVEETASLIAQELQLCDTLTHSKPLAFSRFHSLANYIWDINSFLDVKIHPKDNCYEYIQGSFRPNTQKILDLLGGNQLYGDSIWAFRELLQNAFDAVKQRIAYQILNENRDPDVFLEKLGELYSIKISLEQREDGYWLICKDDGVGMTKDIIEKFFLVSGTSKRHEIKDLERKCKEKGFNLGSTGQFGIGVLSYFMIAEKVVVITKREQNTGYKPEDSIPWRFELNGREDFGELMRYNQPIQGTTIEMKLSAKVEQEIETWGQKLSDFLEENVVKTPCTISYSSCLDTNDDKTFQEGWIKHKNELTRLLTDSFIYKHQEQTIPHDKNISSVRKNRMDEGNRLVHEYAKDVQEKIDFLYAEGSVGNFANYRIFIPYFKLSGGNSFCYMKEDRNSNRHYIKLISSQEYLHVWFPDRIESFSYKGIKTNAIVDHYIEYDIEYEILRLQIPSSIIEVDFIETDEDFVHVNRHNIVLSEDDIALIKSYIRRSIDSLLYEHQDSFQNIYTSLNRYTMHDQIQEFKPELQYWAFTIKGNDHHDADTLEWKKIQFPAITYLSEDDFHFDKLEASLLTQNTSIGKQTLNYFLTLNNFESSSLSLGSASWRTLYTLDYRLGISFVHYREKGVWLIPVAMGWADLVQDKVNEGMNSIELPHTLRDILYYSEEEKEIYSWRIYINKENPLFQYYYPYIDFDVYEVTELAELRDKEHCFAFLSQCIMKFNEDNWIGYYENNTHIVDYAFKQLSITEIKVLSSNGNVICIGPNRWDDSQNVREALKDIYENEPQYRIVVEDDKETDE